jgi:predicted RNase H-like HicB family nuclease
MKTVIVIVEKTDTGYSAYVDGVDGIITVGDTFTELRGNMEEAIGVFLETSKEFNDEIPEVLSGDYSLNFKFDVQTFFEWLSKSMTQKGLSDIAEMNETLISQYSTGVKKPGPKQLKRMETALHRFADDLQAISF